MLADHDDDDDHDDVLALAGGDMGQSDMGQSDMGRSEIGTWCLTWLGATVPFV